MTLHCISSVSLVFVAIVPVSCGPVQKPSYIIQYIYIFRYTYIFYLYTPHVLFAWTAGVVALHVAYDRPHIRSFQVFRLILAKRSTACGGLRIKRFSLRCCTCKCVCVRVHDTDKHEGRRTKARE